MVPRPSYHPLGQNSTRFPGKLCFFCFFFCKFFISCHYSKTIQQYKEEKKNITYNLNITYSPDGTYTTTMKINTNKPNITYYKHVHVTVITNTSILCYGERKENGNITMQNTSFLNKRLKKQVSKKKSELKKNNIYLLGF